MHGEKALKAGQVCLLRVGTSPVSCTLRGHFSCDPDPWHKHRGKDRQTITEL